MRRKLIFVACLVMVGLVALPVVAKKKKAPQSQLMSISYHWMSPMDPQSEQIVELTRHKDGRRTLMLNGSCGYERVRFDVDEDVFLHCDSIIKATKIYESKGNYEPKDRTMIPTDAPASSFYVSYADYNENFSCDGYMPDEIWKGRALVLNYLQSLRGESEAKGHMNAIGYLKSTDKIMGTRWVSGQMAYIPGDDIEELPRFLSQLYDFDYVSDDWNMLLEEGCGQRCFVVINRNQNINDVLIDEKTVGVKAEGLEGISGQWPQTSQRVLMKSEIENLPTDTLCLMAAEILVRHDFDPRLSDELKAQLKCEPCYDRDEDPYLTDIERVNDDQLTALIHRRNKK